MTTSEHECAYDTPGAGPCETCLTDVTDETVCHGDGEQHCCCDGPCDYARPVADDVKTLAEWLHDYGLCREIVHYGWEHETDPPTSPCFTFARALRDRIAAAEQQARADERERIAQTIERAMPSADEYGTERPDDYYYGMLHAARIAREGGQR